jgi:hypothetical protein
MTDHVDPFATPAPSSSPEDLLASIKNDAGEPKYKTIEDALKALANSQAFIPTLLNEKKSVEEELNKLREEAKKVSSIEEVLAKLTANTDNTPKPVDPPVSGLSPEAVAELVRKTLAEETFSKAAQENYNKVQSTLIGKFGDKTQAEVARKAAELGTSPEKLGELARTAPAMVLALFNSPRSPVNPSSNSINLPTNPQLPTLEAPTKSLLLGATSRDQKEYMLKVKEAVWKRHNIEN